MFYKNKGSSLTQYIIIIALVALALVPVFYFFGKTIFDQFDKFSKTFSSKPQNDQTIKPKVDLGNTGPLGGTADHPVSKCTNGICTIDFGDYVLTGIPANFQDFVQSGGTSGGTDELASLFEQIAKQLEKEGNLTGSKKFKDLANLGHFNAVIQKKVETIANQCMSSSDKETCLFKNPSLSTIENVPTNISHLLPNYNLDGKAATLYGLVEGTRLDRNNDRLQANVYENNKTMKSGGAMYALYKEIMEDKSISDTTKKVTQESLLIMDQLSFELFNNVNGYSSVPASPASPGTQDQATSFVDGSTLFQGSISNSDLNNITKPKTAIKTNIESAFICATGKNLDSGKACH